ncbi:MAG: hypothetical protein OXN27_14260 [Candidatus Poribacteria bacterium]|nr:hypothetical protein [Candidatus Poribacteria bacterium]
MRLIGRTATTKKIWIPYQLAEPVDVTLTIYDIQGHMVCTLDLGHQRAGLYQNCSRAAYWDGKDALHTLPP